MCVFLEKPTGVFSRKFGNVLCLKRSALHTKKGNVLQKKISRNKGSIMGELSSCLFCVVSEKCALKRSVTV